MSATEDEIDDTSAPLIEHLAELRTRLIRAVLAFVVAMMACFAVAQPIMAFLLTPIEQSLRSLGDPNPVMQYTAPQEYFFTLVRISMVGGLALSFPVIAYQLWRFVAPGLYKSEKAAFLPFLLASPLLFIAGASFAHYVVTPFAMRFFLGFADAASLLTTLVPGVEGEGPSLPASETGIDIVFQGKVNETLDISLKLIVAFGLCFQLPVLLTLMGKAGLVTASGLARMRKYAVVLILMTAALVTPPDVITQLILFFAIYPLYEISIFLIRRIEAGKERELREAGVLGANESLYDDDTEEDLKA